MTGESEEVIQKEYDEDYESSRSMLMNKDIQGR